MSFNDIYSIDNTTLNKENKDNTDIMPKEQSLTYIHEYRVSIEEYEKIANNLITSYMLGSKDKNIKEGDIIAITCNNIQLKAVITQTRNYPDYISLPNEKYGFDIGTYNPYFYDNSTIKEYGGVTLADFKIIESKKTHDLFTVNYWEHQLKGFEDAKQLYLVRKENNIFMHVSPSSKFILKECMGVRTIKGSSLGKPQLILSKENLFAEMDEIIPSIPTRKEIENGSFSKEDFDKHLLLIKLEITE